MIKNSEAKVVIIDDDPYFYNILTIYLRKIGIDKIFIGSDSQSGKELIEEEKPNLVLLDIDLKSNESGIDIGLYIREKYTSLPIIYFTNNFTDEIFEAAKQVQPNAFLDKQLNELKVRQAVELALMQEVVKVTDANSSSTPLIPNWYVSNEFIFVKVGNTFKKIEIREIDYVFYADRYANLHFDNKNYPVNIPMKNLAESLPKEFLQIHQSYIVNLRRVTQINIIDHQVEVAGKWMPVGGSFRKPLRDKLVLLT